MPVTSGALKKLRNADATHAAFDTVEWSAEGSPVTALIARGDIHFVAVTAWRLGFQLLPPMIAL